MAEICIRKVEPTIDSVWLAEQKYAKNNETKDVISQIKALVSLHNVLVPKISSPENQSSVEQDLIGFSYRTFDDFLKENFSKTYLENKIKDKAGRIDFNKMSSDALKGLKSMLQMNLERMVTLVESPIEYIKKDINTEVLPSTIQQISTYAKAQKPYFFFLKWAALNKRIGNYQAYFRNFKPAHDKVTAIGELSNMMKTVKKRLQLMAKDFEKKHMGAGELSKSKMNDYFPMLNEYKPYSVDDSNQKIRELKEKMESDGDIDNDHIDSIVEFMVTDLKPKWDRINYGDKYSSVMSSKLTGKYGFIDSVREDGNSNRLKREYVEVLQKLVDKQSFLGMKRRALKLYGKVYEGRTEDSLRIREIEQKLSELSSEDGIKIFGGTLGYVPGLREEGSSVFDEVGATGWEDIFPGVIGSLERSVSGKRTGGFIQGFEGSMQEFVGKMDLVAELTGWSIIETKRRKYTEWQDKNYASNKVLKTYYQKLVERADFEGNLTTTAKILKNILPSLNSISAACTLTASGVPNLVYGIQGITAKFSGFRKMHQKYHRDTKTDNTVANILNELNFEDLARDMSIGQPFLKTSREMMTDGENKLVKASLKASRWLNNAGDFLVQQGPLGLFGLKSDTGLGILSFMGTEGTIRSWLMPIMAHEIEIAMALKQANEQIETNLSKEDKTKAVKQLWQERFASVHSRVLEGVGAFDKRYKAYWAYQTLETADTGWKVFGGWALQSLHLFRQVTVHLANLTKGMYHETKQYARDRARNVFTKGDKVTKTAAGISATGIIMALVTALWDEIGAEATSVEVNLVSNTNPISPASRAAKMMYANILAPTFNLPVSEEMYKESSSFLKGLVDVAMAGAERAGGYVWGDYVKSISDGYLPGQRLYEAVIKQEIIGRNAESFTKSINTFMASNEAPLFSHSNDVLKLARLPFVGYETLIGQRPPGDIILSAARNIFGFSAYDPNFLTKQNIRSVDEIRRVVESYRNSDIEFSDIQNDLFGQLDYGVTNFINDDNSAVQGLGMLSGYGL